jgi:general secretion pathway protein H
MPPGGQGNERGFTLLELIIVMLLIAIILGIVTVFFVNTLSAGKFSSTAREVAATIKHARALARLHGEDQTITIDIDGRSYTLEGKGTKVIPPPVQLRVIDPYEGEVLKGTHRILFRAGGGVEGGTIILSTEKRSVKIELDPVVGSVVTKESVR